MQQQVKQYRVSFHVPEYIDVVVSATNEEAARRLALAKLDRESPVIGVEIDGIEELPEESGDAAAT